MMSDIREKLIYWLLRSGCDPEACESCKLGEDNIFSCLRKDAGVKADYFISNGVTIPVHCGECKHYSSGRCDNYHGLYGRPKKDDFCSYGEEREIEL